MNENQEHRGSGVELLLIMLIVAGVVALGMLIASKPLSQEATRREEARASAVMAQAEAQRAGEVERTERERIGQETTQRAAELRAEATARTQDSALLILAFGAAIASVILLGGAAIFAMNWYDGQATRRTLLILEAQRQEQLLQLAARGEYNLRTFERSDLIPLSRKDGNG
jgi:Flp pilus assembly protein TadB